MAYGEKEMLNEDNNWNIHVHNHISAPTPSWDRYFPGVGNVEDEFTKPNPEGHE